MIHFDFTVTDADAENIMEIMRNQILQNQQRINSMMYEIGKEHYIEAYKQDNEYIMGLIKRMTNTRVDN